MLGMILKLVVDLVSVCPAFLRPIFPFVFLVVVIRVGFWLRKQYLKGLGK